MFATNETLTPNAKNDYRSQMIVSVTLLKGITSSKSALYKHGTRLQNYDFCKTFSTFMPCPCLVALLWDIVWKKFCEQYNHPENIND